MELWLRDSGDHRGDPEAYEEAYGRWLDEFEARRTRAVGFGWITIRRNEAVASGAVEPSIVVEEWPHPVEQPLGPTVLAHFERQDYLRTRDDAALLADRFALAPEVVQEQVGLPGAEDPEHVVLRQNRGMRRATRVDHVGAGFAGVCDGTLSAGRILDAIGQLMGEDPVILRDRTPQAIRLLVEEGFLLPVGEEDSEGNPGRTPGSTALDTHRAGRGLARGDPDRDQPAAGRVLLDAPRAAAAAPLLAVPGVGRAGA